MSEITDFKKVVVKVEMSRTFYIESTQSDTKETLMEKAKSQIILPTEINDFLRNYNINISLAGLALDDWTLNNEEYKIEE